MFDRVVLNNVPHPCCSKEVQALRTFPISQQNEETTAASKGIYIHKGGITSLQITVCPASDKF